MVNIIRDNSKPSFQGCGAREQFNSWAKSYSKDAKSWKYSPEKKFLEFIQKDLFDSENPCLLDIGCGNGQTSIPFVQKGFTMHGIDISLEMIKNSRKKIWEKVFIGDISKSQISLPLYDGIVSCGVFGDFVEPRILENYIKNNLKSKAILAIAGYDWPEGDFELIYRNMAIKNNFFIIDNYSDFGYWPKDCFKGPITYRYFLATRNLQNN
jgi:SAM-dependent methyltransferase